MARSHAPRRSTALNALRNPHFRWYWSGQLLSSATMQMGTVAEGWLVYELTGSAFALGWVGAGWSITTAVLSLFAGVISDRMEKRALLLWARSLLSLVSLLLTMLILTGAVQVWHLAVASTLRGVLFALIMPTQQAFLAELVGHKALLNAVSLNSVGMGLMGIVAPSLAGLLIDALGIRSVYALITTCYVGVTLTLIGLPHSSVAPPSVHSVWTDLRAGIAYLRLRPILVPLLGMVFARGLFGMPYRTFLPKFAQDQLGLDAAGYGILSSAPGVGALISSLFLAAQEDLRGKGRVLLGTAAAFGVLLILLAPTSSFPIALALLVAVGVASNACMVTNQTLVQVNVDAAYRGRVMSMYMMMFGLTRIVTIPAGAIADSYGVPVVIGTQGVLLAIAALALLAFHRPMRRME
ncbi:MAG: MFS transporter [Anaerolineae bacterium]|nr:MFS transporter [Anaerolineae bacterium]